jgi:hypothetical protein
LTQEVGKKIWGGFRLVDQPNHHEAGRPSSLIGGEESLCMWSFPDLLHNHSSNQVSDKHMLLMLPNNIGITSHLLKFELLLDAL